MPQELNNISTEASGTEASNGHHRTTGSALVVETKPTEVDLILSNQDLVAERLSPKESESFPLIGFAPDYNLPPNIRNSISPGQRPLVNALINPAVFIDPAVLIATENGENNTLVQAQTRAIQDNQTGLGDKLVYSIPEAMLALKEGGEPFEQIGSMRFANIGAECSWISIVFIVRKNGVWYVLDTISEEEEDDEERLVLTIDSESHHLTNPSLDIAEIKQAFTRSKWAFNMAGMGIFLGGMIDLDQVDRVEPGLLGSTHF